MSQTLSPLSGSAGRRLPDHVIHMRWADLDVLNHVNNVRYLDYVDDARSRLIHEIGPERVLSRCDIEFIRPLELTALPILVTSVIDDHGALQQEIVVDHEEGRVVYARVHSDLAVERAPLEVLPAESNKVYFHARACDVTDGSIGNAPVFGLFQEARILSLGRREKKRPGGPIVVARSTVRYAAPIAMRHRPYEIRSVIERMGRASVTMRMQIVEDGRALAETHVVFVGFDAKTQKSRVFEEVERAYMIDRLAPDNR